MSLLMYFFRHFPAALIIAPYRGHLDIVKELLDAGAEVHTQDKNGWTAMVWAVSRHHNDVIDF